nr:hypothetical protein [Lachnospiraceae bacterium]
DSRKKKNNIIEDENEDDNVSVSSEKSNYSVDDNIIENDNLDNEQTFDNALKNDKECKRKLYAYWDKISKDSMKVKTDVRRDTLAKIVAITTLRSKRIKNGEEHPKITDSEIEIEAKKLSETEEFKRIMYNQNDIKLASGRSCKTILKQLKEEHNNIDNIKDNYKESFLTEYAIGRLNTYYNMLCTTDTGSYFGIKRSKNSDRYEDALTAVSDLLTTEDPDSELIYESVKTIKEYLKDKMEKRSSDFGQQRFNLFMCCLKEVMPRDEFEYYCYEINKARGVVDKYNKDDYVDSCRIFDNSYSIKTWLAQHIKRGIANIDDATDFDFAAAYAVLDYGDVEGNFHPSLDYIITDTDVIKSISVNANKIFRKEDFQEFLRTVPDEKKRECLAKPGKLLDYKTVLEEYKKTQENVNDNLTDNKNNNIISTEQKKDIPNANANNNNKTKQGKVTKSPMHK